MTKVETLLKKVQDASVLTPLVDACPSLVVQIVEQVSKEVGGLTGADKKDTAVTWLVERIKMRFIPKWLQRIVYGVIVDRIVACMNSVLGKRW